MGSDRRAVSTAADVSLALVLIVTAMGVLAVYAEADHHEHDPTDTEYSAQTIAGSTLNTSYTLSTAVDAYFRDHRETSPPYDADDLERVSHGPVAAQVADIAVANLTVDGKQLSEEATDYEHAVEERLQTRLLGSRFELSVSAVWRPFEGSNVRGETVLGEQPPPDADVSTTTLTVPSGLPDAREDTVDAVDGPREYGSVAREVANATVSGLFPELETQRALERSGVDYHLTRYRYERLAAVLDGDWSLFERRGWLSSSSADAEAANAYLGRRLAATVESHLEADHGDRYENATETARSVSTGTVTLTIRTWTHD